VKLKETAHAAEEAEEARKDAEEARKEVRLVCSVKTHRLKTHHLN
jgi:hypothetical protein